MDWVGVSDWGWGHWFFFMPPPGWHKRGGIRISGGGIKGGGIKISDFRGVA